MFIFIHSGLEAQTDMCGKMRCKKAGNASAFKQRIKNYAKKNKQKKASSEVKQTSGIKAL